MARFALTFILVVSAFLAGCSSKSDKELMDSANQNISDEEFAEAIADFESIINEYPQSALVPKALFEIGKIYQGQVIKNISKEESYESAIKYYKQIVDKYPDDPNAPSSLFMIGFIQANELKKLDAARETYKSFVEKYPDHELASSAQAEIDNLGLSPEEILKKKMNNVQK